MRAIIAFAAVLLTSCALQTMPNSPPGPPTIHTEYGETLLGFEPKLASPQLPEAQRKKVFVTSEPRNLISEDVIRQQIIKSNSMMAVERQVAEVVIVIRAYNVEINDGASTTELIMLEQYQVSNFVGRTFFMPNNSSWSVDLLHRSITGAYELAYTIQSNSGQELAQHVHRDRIEKEITTCSQPKITNVFGGVSPANFWADGAIESKCNSGGRVLTKSDVQQVIEDTLGQAVSKTVLSPAVATQVKPGKEL